MEGHHIGMYNARSEGGGLRGLVDMSPQCSYIMGGVSGLSGTIGGCRWLGWCCVDAYGMMDMWIAMDAAIMFCRIIISKAIIITLTFACKLVSMPVLPLLQSKMHVFCLLLPLLWMWWFINKS